MPSRTEDQDRELRQAVLVRDKLREGIEAKLLEVSTMRTALAGAGKRIDQLLERRHSTSREAQDQAARDQIARDADALAAEQAVPPLPPSPAPPAQGKPLPSVCTCRLPEGRGRPCPRHGTHPSTL